MKNLRIAAKLGLGFGVMALLLVGMAVSAWIGLNRVDQTVDLIIDDRYPKVLLVESLGDDLSLQSRLARNLLLMDDPKDRQEVLTRLDASTKKSDASFQKLDQSIHLAEARALFQDLQKTRQAYDGMLRKFLEAVQVGAPGQRDLLLKDLRPVQLAYEASLEKLVKFQEELMAADGRHSQEQVALALKVLLVTTAVGLLVAGCSAVWVTRSLTEPVREVVTRIEALAGGDLTVQVETDRGDELGQVQRAVQRLRDSLTRTVGAVRQNAESVATASAQIAQGNGDLSQRTEEQASALEQTAATMEELGSTVRHNADNARQANQLAQGAAGVAAQGGEVVSRVVTTMQGITESSRKIGDIIGVIDGIAFQTNILALNAAVEAARAGEQGRGFAVVAGEVRTLAQRSAEAAKEIKALIGRNVEQVETGSQLVHQAGSTMEEIVGSIRRVSDIVGEISAASAEQSNGVGQVGQAVTQLDQMTQQNAALVEQSAAAAESLKVQAQQLVQAVAVFKLAGQGHHAQAHTQAPRAPRRAEPSLAAPTHAPGHAPMPAPTQAASKVEPTRPAGAAAKPPVRGATSPVADSGPLATSAVRMPTPAPARPAPVAAPAPAAAAAPVDADEWTTF